MTKKAILVKTILQKPTGSSLINMSWFIHLTVASVRKTMTS